MSFRHNFIKVPSLIKSYKRNIKNKRVRTTLRKSCYQLEQNPPLPFLIRPAGFVTKVGASLIITQLTYFLDDEKMFNILTPRSD